MGTVFRVRVRAHDSGCEVAVTGELDLATAPQPRVALIHAVAEHREVGVDLSGVTFCDCAGLSALLGAARIARSHGTDLHLHSVPARLAKLLRVSHTRSAFVIDDRQLEI